MKVKVGSKIKISNPTKEIIDYCKSNLDIDNPDFFKKERLGKWTGGTPRTICLYEKIGDELWLPFGCFEDVWKLHPIRADFYSEFEPMRTVKYDSLINPYEYQEKAIQATLSKKNGVLVMPCGSGKTQCGLEIISRIGGKALWITHTHDLLMQSFNRANSCFSQGGYGFISAGKVNIGTHITFATIQTLAKQDMSLYENQWDVIVVDEAQHCCGSPTRVTQFYKAVSRLNARYKIGLTATPKRTDGLHSTMFALLGKKIYEVTKADVAHTTCPVKVQTIATGYIPEYNLVLQGDGTIDYSKLIDNLIHDEDRFNIVFSVALSLDGPTIILANRVEYLERMCCNLKMGNKRCVCLSNKGYSKSAKAERKVALEQLNNGEIDCICATYQLASEGLDVPNLRYVVFATPEKNDITVTQAVGRVGRKYTGKEFGTVIDFIDDFGMYRNWYKERMKCYKKINAEVEEYDSIYQW